MARELTAVIGEALDAKADTYSVHPAAECFRLMDEDELAALAADIEANGQRDPIIIGRVNGEKVGSIVDGRNRYAACQRIGIAPLLEAIEFKDDDEVRAFVKSRSERRNLTKGQMAMGVALLYPEPEKGGRGKKRAATNSLVSGGFSRQRLDQARRILRHSRDLALAVRDGVRKLDDALEDIEDEQRALQSDETKLATLQKEAPDLAEAVAEERLKLSEAHAAFEQRKRDEAAAEENTRETLLRLTEAAYRGINSWADDVFAAEVDQRFADDKFAEALMMRLRSTDCNDLQRGAANLSKMLVKLARRKPP